RMKLSEFDFRVWDGKKYINNIKGGVYMHKDNTGVKCLNRNKDCYDYEFELDELDNSNLEIELFTGLCDKNGNKIYEGDIAKIITFSYDFVGHVAYDKEETRFKLIDNKYMEDFANYEDWDSIEVIGNIHENKELLNVRL
ncbi:TPA: YopX family protein, partial [Campylobacter coli]